MKTLKKILVLAVAGIISFSAVAVGDADKNADVVLRERIIQKLTTFSTLEPRNGIALLEFKIDEKNRLRIISLEANDTRLKNHIIKSLDGQKIKLQSEASHEVQHMKLHFKPE